MVIGPTEVMLGRETLRMEERTMQTSEHPSFLNRRGARFRSATICSTALVLFLFASAPAFAGEIDDLKAQVQQLMKRIEVLEAGQADGHRETAKKAEEARKTAPRALDKTLLFNLRSTARFALTPR